MGRDHDVNPTFFQLTDRLFLLIGGYKTRQLTHRHGEPFQAFNQVIKMLAHKHRRRRQKGGLFAFHDTFKKRAKSHFGLPEPDIPADQSIHDFFAFHIAFDF